MLDGRLLLKLMSDAIITLEFSDLICVHIPFLTARCAEAVLKYVFYLPYALKSQFFVRLIIYERTFRVF